MKFEGKAHSSESKTKTSESLKERFKRGLKIWNKGKKLSIETKEKMSIAQRGERNGFFGKTHTEETIKKMKDNHANVKGNKNPAYKGKILSRKGDYVFIYSPNHPRNANKVKGCRVKEHILVVEKKLGRYLNMDEVIHHIDYDKKNNDYNNLFLTNHKGHGKAHYSIYHLVKELLKKKIIYFNK